MAESVGERLRRLRTERGLSQRELGGKGISYAYISRIEHGQRTPSVKALRLLAPKLGVSPDYLEHGRELHPTVEQLQMGRHHIQKTVEILLEAAAQLEAEGDKMKELWDTQPTA